MSPRECRHRRCRTRAVVDLNGEWLCMAHYDEAIAAIARAIRRLREDAP